MRQRMLVNGAEVEFREPFLLYDNISVYDKTRETYVTRKRATGVSISDSQEIAVVMAICSEKDIFSKKIARQIIEGRLNKTILEYLDRKEPTYSHSFTKGSYLFMDFESFNQFCGTLDALGLQFFSPNKIKYAPRLSRQPEELELSSFSDFYMHRTFVTNAWKNYCKAVEEKELTLDTSSFEQVKERAYT